MICRGGFLRESALFSYRIVIQAKIPKLCKRLFNGQHKIYYAIMERVNRRLCNRSGIVCRDEYDNYWTIGFHKKVNFTLDRPFLFYISGVGTMPLFAGKIVNPNES